MSTSITKIASLEVISEAMGDLYNKTLVKKAQENTYAKAVSKLENSAKKGYSLAQTVLDALKGKAPKTTAIDVTSPSLGLDQQEAYAIGGQLSDLGYQISRTTGASGAGLQQAMESYLGGSGEDVYAKEHDTNFDPLEEERRSAFSGKHPDEGGKFKSFDNEGNETATEVASSDYPRGTLPIGSTKGEKPTSGPHYPTSQPGISGEDYQDYNQSLPMSEDERKEFEEHRKRSLNSIKILNTIEKIANILDSAGFEKSAEVADELIEKVAIEMNSRDLIEEGIDDTVDQRDLEEEEGYQSYLEENYPEQAYIKYWEEKGATWRVYGYGNILDFDGTPVACYLHLHGRQMYKPTDPDFNDVCSKVEKGIDPKGRDFEGWDVEGGYQATLEAEKKRKMDREIDKFFGVDTAAAAFYKGDLDNELVAKAAYDPSSPDPLGSFDLEGEELSVKNKIEDKLNAYRKMLDDSGPWGILQIEDIGREIRYLAEEAENDGEYIIKGEYNVRPEDDDFRFRVEFGKYYIGWKTKDLYELADEIEKIVDEKRAKLEESRKEHY